MVALVKKNKKSKIYLFITKSISTGKGSTLYNISDMLACWIAISSKLVYMATIVYEQWTPEAVKL